MFCVAIEEALNFVHEPGCNTRNRALVAGIIRLKYALAINLRQFLFLYPKSKSAINLSLNQLNYAVCSFGSNCQHEFAEIFGEYCEDFRFTKQWTIRLLPLDPQQIQFDNPNPANNNKDDLFQIPEDTLKDINNYFLK
jgi:hypothetical protein